MQIAFVSSDPHYDGLYGEYLREMHKPSIDCKFMHQMVPAITELRSNRYPLIITALNLAPCLLIEPELEELISNGRGNPPYYLLGIHLIERIREEESANVDTPIIVMDHYRPNAPFPGEGAYRFGNNTIVRDIVLAKGATDYIYKPDVDIYRLADIVESYRPASI